MKHTIRLFAVLMGILLTSFAVPTLAQAEQCSPDGKICLVTDTSQPLVTPTTLQFRVTSEADHFNGRLVQQGPGDTNLWDVDFGPEWAPSDTVLAVEVNAFSGTVDYRATFQVPVLSPVANLHAQIVRQGKRFVAKVSYDGRTTAQTRFGLVLGIDQYGVQQIMQKRKLVTLPAGHQVIQMVVGRSIVQRKCKKYPYCKLLVGVAQAVPYYDEQGSQRYFQIAPDPVNGAAGLVVKNKHKHRK
jgi:hypothetical protein